MNAGCLTRLGNRVSLVVELLLGVFVLVGWVGILWCLIWFWWVIRYSLLALYSVLLVWFAECFVLLGDEIAFLGV